ncbi:hypothetical protein OROMI_016648 [Orobanche minor]
MLLLNKKKYAAVKVQYRDGTPYEVIERKGVDMVRRDWSLLSKDLGDYCLSQILSGGSCEEVVESIYATLARVQEAMQNGQIALEEYVIVRTLTKAPEAYPGAKNQSHVQLSPDIIKGKKAMSLPALREIYSGSSSGIAQRARHPDELTKGNVTWMIDIDYDLTQQFQSKSAEVVVNELGTSLLSGLDADERTLDCPTTVTISISSSFDEKSTDMQDGVSTRNFWCKLCCPQCPEENDSARLSPALIANQVKRQADGFISRHSTRSLNMGVLGDSERVYRKRSIKGNSKMAAEKEEARISLVVESAAKTVQKIKDTCSYGWVMLNDLTVSIYFSAKFLLVL